MRLQTINKYVSRFLEPTRVFIALMLAVGMWLFPFISFKEKTIMPIEHGEIISAVPFSAGAIGECSNVRCDPGYCCQFGYCVVKNKADCGQDDPPPPSPPTISANLNCSDWGDNGWCKGSLSIDLSAADPQGQAVVISGAVNGNNFACPSGDTSCSIPLSGEGTGSVSYQVNSATGLSAAGSLGYQIDLTSPDLDTSVSGAAGTNGWYRSDVTLGVSTSDATSGIASITASINGGGAASVGGSLIFSDGEYSVLIVARDNAGHVTQDTQIIKVDTITPSLSFSTNGTNGMNGWYVSDASATPSASDPSTGSGQAGSGIAAIEASVDGGGWSAVGSLSFTDGEHTYKFRAIDNAGNITETPLQYLNVDTTPPSIEMSQGTSLGDEVRYKIEDYGSGLSIYRAIIEDNGAVYQKAVWAGNISGKIIQSKILWDGSFGDNKASVGEYMIMLKITDAAGNQAIATSYVSVNLLSFLQDLSDSTPPDSSVIEEDVISDTTQVASSEPVTFGGIPTTTDIGEYVTTDVSVASTTIPFTNIPLDPNILWGAAATAMVGATLADWARKREEEARRRAAERAEEDRRANTEKRKAQKAAETAVRERWVEQKNSGAGSKAQPAPQKIEPPMPKGLSPEAQAAYLHGGVAASSWIGSNAGALKAQYAADLAKQKAKEEDKAAYDHRMDEHTGEQDKVDAWYAQQHRLSEHNMLGEATSSLPAVAAIPNPTPSTNSSQLKEQKYTSNSTAAWFSEIWQQFKNEAAAVITLQDLNNIPDEVKQNSLGLGESLLTDKRIIRVMENIQGLPAFKVVFPILEGFGIENIPAPYVVPTSLVKTIESDAIVRSAGRALSGIEEGPAGIIAGVTISVWPNLDRNIKTNQPLQRLAADFVIDALGSLVTEVISIPISLLATALRFGQDILTIGPGAFPDAIPTYVISRIVSESYLSLAWESAINRYNIRNGVTDIFTDIFTVELFPPKPIAHPSATPNPSPSIDLIPPETITPSPSIPPQPNFESTPRPLSTDKIEIISTQTPAPPGE